MGLVGGALEFIRSGPGGDQQRSGFILHGLGDLRLDFHRGIPGEIILLPPILQLKGFGTIGIRLRYKVLIAGDNEVDGVATPDINITVIGIAPAAAYIGAPEFLANAMSGAVCHAAPDDDSGDAVPNVFVIHLLEFRL